ncbi:MAG: HEAT repeat domain-containing protein [Planctomycetes bacterium]|jgi:hypothetical protein|nr:HEAT repeat domain-containing protein [Planctomycetota bacterium]
MTFVASLFLASLPQVLPGGDITLPPPKDRPAARVAAVRPESELTRFRRDLTDLHGSPERVEGRLHRIGTDYAEEAIEPLVLEVARVARGTELGNLMLVVRRYGAGRRKVGDELLFQLLARPLADATRPVVDAMVYVKGSEAKAALLQCVRGRIAGVRRHAVEVLIPMLTADDLPFALELSREQSLDLQLRGVEMLRALAVPPALERLVELLSKDPALAGAACQALVQVGAPAVPVLQRLVTAPPIDRGFVYGAFALAQLAQHGDRAVLPAGLAAPLQARVADLEPLTRALAAIPLADLAYRAEPGQAAFPDAAIVDALLEVVQPRQFVPSLDLLRRPAEERLLRITGRIVPTGEGLAWRQWWELQRADFLGVRGRIDVDATQAARAVVSWRHENRHVRVLAEAFADVAPVDGATEIVLAPAAMLELVQALDRGGFHDEARMRVDSALPRVRSLQLQVPSGRSLVAMPAGEYPAFDSLVALVQQQVDAEAWQLYRIADNEPDRAAFWRAERRWREANPDPVARGRRFVARVVGNWSKLSEPLRARALEQFVSHPQRKQLFTEVEGEQAIAALQGRPELQELDLRLLELAAAVDGDRVWRQAVDLAARAKGGGRAAVRAVFGVLGPDAVLSALQDQNPLVRRAGIDELVVVRDVRAAPRLVELLADADLDVRTAAVMACGQLQVAQASQPLVAAIVADDTPAAVRREALRSLGRVGGEQAFAVLQRASTAPVREDKEAALRGLGELRDPRASHLLAELAVISFGTDIGALARYHLQRQGGSQVVPALRRQLELVQNPEIRDQLVLMLGAYQDAASVPDLLDLLRKPTHAPAAAILLAGTTGIDLSGDGDRIGLAEAWYRDNRARPQWQWLLDALRVAQVRHGMTPEQFALGGAAVPVAELARLLVEVTEPRLWALSAAVLRTTTGEDFGVVTMQTPLETREAIAARYRSLAEANRAAQGK